MAFTSSGELYSAVPPAIAPSDFGTKPSLSLQIIVCKYQQVHVVVATVVLAIYINKVLATVSVNNY